MPGRRCVRCGADFTEDEVASGQAFRRQGAQDASCARWDSVCRPCRESASDERKGSDRYATKANDARTGHAAKLSKPRTKSGVVAWYDPDLTSTKLELVYGWAQHQMRHDFEFDYGNGCDYCHRPYKSMGHGLADITIDIYDPRLAPDYSNTRRCCMTCQRRKGLLTPEQWAVKQRCYRKRDAALSATADFLGQLFVYRRDVA